MYTILNICTAKCSAILISIKHFLENATIMLRKYDSILMRHHIGIM